MSNHKFATGNDLYNISTTGTQTNQYIIKKKINDYKCQLKTSRYIHPPSYYQDNQLVLLDDCEKIAKAGSLVITNTYVKLKHTFNIPTTQDTPTEILFSDYIYPAIVY